MQLRQPLLLLQRIRRVSVLSAAAACQSAARMLPAGRSGLLLLPLLLCR
jgi:hypothetical protein